MLKQIASVAISGFVAASSVIGFAGQAMADDITANVDRITEQACADAIYSSNSFFTGYMLQQCRLLLDIQADMHRRQSQPRATYTAAPRNTTDYRTIGSHFAYLYDNGREILPGVVQAEDIYLTRQVADDGNVVYYARWGSNRDRIFRYNQTRNAVGFTQVYSKVCSTGYMKGRVEMESDRGVRLDSPEVTNVETENMYPGLQALICN